MLTPAASNPFVATEAMTIAPALVCDHDGPRPDGGTSPGTRSRRKIAGVAWRGTTSPAAKTGRWPDIPRKLVNKACRQSKSTRLIDELSGSGRSFLVVRPLRRRRLRFLGQDRIAYPRGAATTTGCPCAGSRCECAAFAGRGHNTRWSSLAIERTQRIASTGLAQTAIVIGHKAQIGRLPIACSPFAPGNRISVCGQQPVPDRQRPRSGTRADDRASVGRGVSRLC